MNLNKLFCTFVKPEDLDEVVNKLSTTYTMTNDKMFVLESDDTSELMITYNIDPGNMKPDQIPAGTINVHRRKESNSLYSINALNHLIKLENNGVFVKNFYINWNKYPNCIILLKDNDLRIIHTRVHKIIYIN